MKTPTNTPEINRRSGADYFPERQLSIRADRNDNYAYDSFGTSEEATELIRTVYEVHAKSYIGEGFVSEAAMTEDGVLAGDIDKLRGEGVTHYLGYKFDDGKWKACSTLRKMSLTSGQSIEDLPGYRQCVDHLTPEVKEWLASIPVENVREIGAFGHVPEVSSKAGLELLRHVLQDSLGKNEVWFFTMVERNVERLVKHFGPEAVRIIGEPVKLEDSRVNGVRLVPTIVDVDAFFEQVRRTAMAEENEVVRRHHQLSLMNFSEGLEPKTEEVPSLNVPSDVFFHEQVRAAEAARTSNSEVWTPPIRFDMSLSDDRRRAMELYESGAIEEVRSAAAGSLDELFELKNPSSRYDERARAEFIEAMQAQGDSLGNWFYYPWHKALVQFLDKDDYQSLRTARNRVLWTEEEQKQLMKPHVLIAGMSTGSGVLEQFLHNGVGGGYILSDFDTLATTNLNRIHATAFDLGRSKAVTAARRVSEVDPYVDQVVMGDGIDAVSLERLAVRPAIIFDQVDDFAAKALLRVYARTHGIPLIMASDVGTTALIDVERYDTEAPQPFNGRLHANTVEKMLAGALTEEDRTRITTSLIGLSNASFRLLDSAIQKDALGGFPQRGTTASLGALSATEIAADILLGRPVASGRRKIPLRKALGLSAEDDFGTRLAITRKYIEQRRQAN